MTREELIIAVSTLGLNEVNTTGLAAGLQTALVDKVEAYTKRPRLRDVVEAAEEYLGHGQAFWAITKELIDDHTREFQELERLLDRCV